MNTRGRRVNEWGILVAEGEGELTGPGGAGPKLGGSGDGTCMN